jgi:hypothetical protein
VKLGTSAFGSGTVYAGPVFTPAAQPAGSASIGTGQAATISQRAFGIAQSPQSGPKTAHYGTVGSTALAVGLLLFIWWSLPR